MVNFTKSHGIYFGCSKLEVFEKRLGKITSAVVNSMSEELTTNDGNKKFRMIKVSCNKKDFKALDTLTSLVW